MPDELLQHVDPNRRAFIKKLVGVTAFVTPIVASFSMEGLTVPLHAQGPPGGSNMPPCTPPNTGSPVLDFLIELLRQVLGRC